MKAESQSWQQIFQSTIKYTVPLYQRPYVWRHTPEDPERDRLGPFWEDVKQTIDRLIAHQDLVAAAGGDLTRVAAMTPHFFGAVVVDRPTKISGTGITAHEVIDGQQRLTTTQLFISAATRLCEQEGRATHASRLRKLWMQDTDIEVSGSDRFKLAPTSFDVAAFERVQSEGPSTRTAKASSTIDAAYEFFTERLREWVADIPDGKHDVYFDALRDTIYEHLLLVVIELQAGDNPQGIFESLNAQGERLLAIDLVKNHVFQMARQAGMDLAKLDTEVWSARFNDDWWRVPIKQGRYKRPRAELFLMHWLTDQTTSEVSATGLYVEYVQLASRAVKDSADTAAFIDGFVRDAGIYRNLSNLPSDSREALFFNRRATLDASVVYPVALRLWRLLHDEVIDHEQLVLGLRALESWLVRRMVVKLTNRNYNRVMLDLLTAMSGSATPVAAMIGRLRSWRAVSNVWPSDEDFVQQLVDQPLYRALPPARITMLLWAAESQLRTAKTEQMPLPPKLSIEHVIPQTWRETWPLPADADEQTVQARTSRLHRLGNLTLVTGALNGGLSNDPWAAKVAELTAHSALRLNARLVADHPDAFTEQSIDERGRALALLLAQEWPGPSSNVWGSCSLVTSNAVD